MTEKNPLTPGDAEDQKKAKETQEKARKDNPLLPTGEDENNPLIP